MVKLRRKKSAQECPFECGGGCNFYLGNAHIEVGTNWKVLPLYGQLVNVQHSGWWHLPSKGKYCVTIFLYIYALAACHHCFCGFFSRQILLQSANPSEVHLLSVFLRFSTICYLSLTSAKQLDFAFLCKSAFYLLRNNFFPVKDD